MSESPQSETTPGAVFEGTVRGLSSEGYGVVEHPGGRVFFVAGAWPGDQGRFTVLRFEKRYGFARLEQLRQASPDRVAAPCPHQGVAAGRCGGCPWMIGTYESQLAHKQHRLQHALSRAGLLADSSVLRPILAAPRTEGYRNRAQFKTDGQAIGFVSEGTRALAPLKDCLVLNEPMRAHLRRLRARLPEPAWRPTPGHEWNFIDADDTLGPDDELALNRRRPFRQGNSAQNERMRGWVRDKALTWAPDAEVIELYAGSGNFTEVLSAAGLRRVHAFEGAREAIAALDARRLFGVTGQVADLSRPEHFQRLAARRAQARIVVLDPPRAGAKGVERLAAGLRGLERVLYVSCDPATFVRDAVALVKQGLRLVEVQPLDMFPHTPHIELMAEFTR